MKSSLLPAVVAVSLGLGCSSQNSPHESGTQPSLEASLVDRSEAEASGSRGDASPDQAATDDASPDAPGEAGSPPGDGGPDDQTAAAVDAAIPSDAADARAVGADVGPAPSPDICLPACAHGTCSPSAGYCYCDVGWAGPACDIGAPAPDSGAPVAGTVAAGQWVYYSFQGVATGVTATLTEDSTVGLVWLYLETNQTPDRSSYLSKDENTTSSSHTVSRSFASPGTQLWYVGAYGQPATPAGQAVPYHVTLTVIP